MQSQDLEGIDTESLAWGKLDRGRGWAIVAKKKALFTTLSVFLGKYQKLLEDHGGNHASGNGKSFLFARCSTWCLTLGQGGQE